MSKTPEKPKAKQKCILCGGKGHYIAVVPPGKDVKVHCFCKGLGK